MLQSLNLHLKGIGAVLRLFKTASGPLTYRFKIMKKYFPVYIHHSRYQQNQFEQNLKHLQQQQKETAYQDQLKSFYTKYSQKIKGQMKNKVKQLQEKDKSEYEKQVRSLLYRGMEYLSLYYESLQNLIEGRRQVLHDQSFKFEDEQTVEHKRIKFEKYLSRLLGRKQEEIERLEEEQQMKKQNQKQKQDF